MTRSEEASILLEAASIIDFYGTGDEPVIRELHAWADTLDNE